MRKGRTSNSEPKNTGDEVKSRKQLRKQKKIEKKQKKRQYFENKNKTQNSDNKKQTYKTSTNQSIKKNNTQRKHINAAQTRKKEAKTTKIDKNQLKKQAKLQTEDDMMIRLCEKKLGIAEGKDKYGKIAKKFGFDDDIFDFLDGISKKVYNQQQNDQQRVDQQDDQQDDLQMEAEQGNNFQQEQDGNEEEQEQQQQMDQQNDQFDKQFNEMFDNLDQVEYLQANDQFENQIQQDPEVKVKKRPKMFFNDPTANHKESEIKNKSTNNTNKQSEDESPQKQQIKKSMNSLFNKLSDGNVLLTFRELLKIIQSNPKSMVIPIFAQLFTKFNLMIEKPLFHILATNVALLAALHYAVGNRFIAPVLQVMTEKYLKVDAQAQNQEQVLQLGYSKHFQRLKNYATIISLLYNYNSISGQFIQSFVTYLIAKMNKSNIELIYIVIQKCGTYIRAKDPSTLKTVIGLIKGAIDVLKQRPGGSEEQQKVHFIELQLNQIRFNKKSQNAIDQRMAFLQTFINKNVKKQIQREKEVFPLDFEKLKNMTCQQLSRTNWWDTDQHNNLNQQQDQQNQEQGQQLNEVLKQKNRLFELAKSFHMVTQTKRNIFVCLMDSKDYLQATQRILQLKVKNMQEVATVLVQICTQQPNFNPYYPFVAAKLASLIPKFRLNLQYALWDHLKLIGQYELRRTSNLAKFAAKLIAQPLSNCSLSLLKFYPDLSNLQTVDRTFLDIFFGYFFKKVKKEYLSKLVNKLRQDNNRDVKLGIQEYLSEYEPQNAVREKVQICRRLLAVELDERKLQRNDDGFE